MEERHGARARPAHRGSPPARDRTLRKDRRDVRRQGLRGGSRRGRRSRRAELRRTHIALRIPHEGAGLASRAGCIKIFPALIANFLLSMAKILGIGLGTTNSAMAVVRGGEPIILENAEGARKTPSIVAISKTGERLVGLLARRQAVTNPKNTVYQIKRFIGHDFTEEAIQKDKESVPFEMSKSDTGGVSVKIGENKYK